MRLSIALILVAATTFGAATQSPAPAALEKAFEGFWAADSPEKASDASRQVLTSGASFDELLTRLKAGRPYRQRPTGRVEMGSIVRGEKLDNVVEVPAGYTPAKALALRIWLHGGVSREPPEPGGARPPALASRMPREGELSILPRAWASSKWWTVPQVENVLTLLDRVKRAYNVDESRVYVAGFSDGGTGVYYLAMRAATPWASCIPLHAHPAVLANRSVGAEGELYPGNLVNCPMRVVNGGRDPLYPAASVTPLIEMFTRGGVPVDYQIYPDAGHDMSWLPQESPRLDAFLAAHSRVAHPDRVSWETERIDRFNRFRWLVIDQLAERSSDVALPDVNRFSPDGRRELMLYARTRPSGRVDAVRRGNTFEVKTRGVRQFTLLLSPDAIDFAQPVRVIVNTRALHDAVVKRDPAALLKWAARDNDRTMLYGAELKVAVP